MELLAGSMLCLKDTCKWIVSGGLPLSGLIVMLIVSSNVGDPTGIIFPQPASCMEVL